MDELNDQIDDSNRLLGIVLLSSLLLSGIILTSMMLISVHKRVSEIGIRQRLKPKILIDKLLYLK